jgi:amidase
MKERGVDFILCPAATGVAAELNVGKYWPYTAIWNILDQPAVSFPTGLKADPSIDLIETGYKPQPGHDEREYKRCESSHLYQPYPGISLY